MNKQKRLLVASTVFSYNPCRRYERQKMRLSTLDKEVARLQPIAANPILVNAKRVQNT